MIPVSVQNVIIEKNYITMSQGWSGAAQDGTDNSIFTSRNNQWIANNYCVASATHPRDGYSVWLARLDELAVVA